MNPELMNDQEFESWLIENLQDMHARWSREVDRSMEYMDEIIVLRAENQTLRNLNTTHPDDVIWDECSSCAVALAPGAAHAGDCEELED